MVSVLNKNLPNRDSAQWDAPVDVVVVGAGFAGLTAAVEAARNGASVLVLEKMHAPGGNSIISDGGIAAPDTDMQRRLGIEDSPELMYRDMLEAGLGLNVPDLLHTVTAQAKEAFEWSRDYLGVGYLERSDIFGGHSVSRCYTPEGVTGALMMKRLMEKAKELGIQVRCRARFESFIQDSDGRVRGVTVRENYDYKDETRGAVSSIAARRGVVLAAGGFGADVTFRQLQDPRLTEGVDTTNKPFATAEVLRESLRIGAAPVQLSLIQLGAWASPDEKGFGDGPRFADYVVFQYGIIIDPVTGSRFINELGDRKRVADALLQRGRPCVGIADAAAVRTAGWDLDKALRKNVVRIFDDLAGLSTFYDIDPEALKQTVDRYNGFVRSGTDNDFGKPIVKAAQPIEQSPYYAMRLWPKVHFTMGGVAINARGQVLDSGGHTIKGLYAAGEVTGGVHGACRLGSCAVTECLVFGRITGRNAALDFTS